MRMFLKVCLLMLWALSVFGIEALVIHFGDPLLSGRPANWMIAGPLCVLGFLDIASIITWIFK